MINVAKMEIGNILKERKFERPATPPKRPINYNWEEAKLFCDYCKIGTESKTIIQILRLFKLHGKEKVLCLQSWLKDNKFDSEKAIGLIVWKLKEKQNAKNSN